MGAGDTVLELLDGYPEATVLATSLREIGVPGERLVRLGPLPIDHTDEPQSPAVRLFLDRAASKDVTHRVTPDDLAAAERIACTTGGLPLAIELAAARVGDVEVDGVVGLRQEDRRGLVCQLIVATGERPTLLVLVSDPQGEMDDECAVAERVTAGLLPILR